MSATTHYTHPTYLQPTCLHSPYLHLHAVKTALFMQLELHFLPLLLIILPYFYPLLAHFHPPITKFCYYLTTF